MVRNEIIITDFKDTSAKRTSFDTNVGKMSAFKNEGDTMVDDLKTHINRLIAVDVTTQISKTDGKTYYNIRDFFGAIADPTTGCTEVIESKKFVSDMTKPKDNQFFKKKETNTEILSSMRKPVKGTAYEKDPVGLAVEIFNNIVGEYDKANATYEIVMEDAIRLVKQAQKAFS